jgi:hypothetical protein
MKEYIVDRNRRIMIYELHEALVAAGSSDTDHVFEQDQKLESFFTGCRVQRLLWNPATYDHDLEQAVSDSVEVLIITRK